MMEMNKDCKSVGTEMKDEIIVRPSPSADTRSADHAITEDELRVSTAMHIRDVQHGMDWFAEQLRQIGEQHDWTKVEFFKDFYNQFRKAQEIGDWGTGWYDKIHVARERHHLDDRCPDDVTLLDVIEQIVDGVMAGMARSGKYVLRLPDTAILERAYMNTQEMLAKVVRVAEPDSQVVVKRETAVPRETQSAVCNAAKLREALDQLRTWALMDINENAARVDEINYKQLLDGIVKIANAALAAPPRNCDVYATEEAANAAWANYKASCPAPPGGWRDCDLLGWLLAPAVQGEKTNAG